MFKFLKYKDNITEKKEVKLHEKSQNENKKEQVKTVAVLPRNNQQIPRGPRSQFSEEIKGNLALVYKRINDDQLITEELIIGTRSKRKIVIAYIKDIVNPGILEEVKQRLLNIKAEFIVDSSYIERQIQDSSWSPFPQIEVTLKPDVVESALIQGRVAILVDNSPDVLLAPTTIFDLLDTPDDAYRRWFVASSYFRVIRFLLFLSTVFLTPFYIALTSFNPEMLPTALTLSIAGVREGTPFPVYLEAFLILGVAEGIRMIRLRMPTDMGSNLSMVAALIFIIAGLQGNIFSGPIVMVVTVSLIASFTIPNLFTKDSIDSYSVITSFGCNLVSKLWDSCSSKILSIYVSYIFNPHHNYNSFSIT